MEETIERLMERGVRGRDYGADASRRLSSTSLVSEQAMLANGGSLFLDAS